MSDERPPFSPEEQESRDRADEWWADQRSDTSASMYDPGPAEGCDEEDDDEEPTPPPTGAKA